MNEQDSHKTSAACAEIAHIIGSRVNDDGAFQVMDDVVLNRASQPSDLICGVSRPSFCIVAQGAKEVYLGDSRYIYDPRRYLLATVEMPVTARVIEASPDQPYLSLRLDFDPALIGSIIMDADLPELRSQSDSRAIVTSPLSHDLVEAMVRFLRAMDSPMESRVLLPLIKREIIFRLLMGEQGYRLRQMSTIGSNTHTIAQALEMLRKDFDRPLRIDSIAKELGMSSSGFHHHFKAVTDMSPLQFQKQLRLQEARRLMFSEHMDAASAGYRVGYDDASHFSRDYKKRFGDSPGRDVERIRSAVGAGNVGQLM